MTTEMSKIARIPPANTIVPMDGIRLRYPIHISEEESMKKATQTIHARMKQIVWCTESDKFDARWKRIAEILEQRQFKRSKKDVIEKLDEENNLAAIHYAVQANNRYVCRKLIYDYKCGTYSE